MFLNEYSITYTTTRTITNHVKYDMYNNIIESSNTDITDHSVKTSYIPAKEQHYDSPYTDNKTYSTNSENDKPTDKSIDKPTDKSTDKTPVKAIANKKIKIKIKTKTKSDKDKIIDIFNDKIRNKTIPQNKTKHDGYIGNWVENQFGIKANSKNEPDIFGYELKKDSKKITFGDFSASEYLFTDIHSELDKLNKNIVTLTDFKISRQDYIRLFGTLKIDKGRHSWSGSCVPRYPTGKYNDHGQKLVVTDDNDIVMYYSYKHVKNNTKYIPYKLQTGEIAVAIWKHEKMSKHINQKFNQKGFIILGLNSTKTTFTKISFAKPLDYTTFIKHFKKGNIFFDSGMYEDNNRNYSQFRAHSDFWKKQIIAEY